MTFWDSSALVPLFVEEARSKACRSLRRAHGQIAVWTLTQVEITSGLQRLVREHALDEDDLAAASRRVDRLLAASIVIEHVEGTKERALRLLGVHPLSGADALQLGAALLLVDDRPRNRPFVCADDRLARAARAEGFDVLVPA